MYSLEGKCVGLQLEVEILKCSNFSASFLITFSVSCEDSSLMVNLWLAFYFVKPYIRILHQFFFFFLNFLYVKVKLTICK